MTTFSCLSHCRSLRKLTAGLGAFVALWVWAGPSGADARLIEQLRTIRIAGTGSFVAAERFSVGRTIGARRLGSVGLNFKQHFLALVEDDVPQTSLAVWNLRYTMGDTSLIKELAGADKAPVSHLAYVHGIMEMGEESAGHNDWRSNFAYVRSPVDHRLWAVHWSVNHAGEWTIGAVYVPHADLDWPAGSRLFSARVGSETAHSNPAAGE